MATTRHILQSLFGSLGGDVFISEYWPKAAYHEDGDPARLPPVLRVSVLNDFATLARVYRGPAFYIAGEGSVLKPLDRPPLDLYRTGHSVYFGDVAPFIRGSRIFLGALEAELGVTPGCARMGVLASPPETGIRARYEVNDVLSIQLVGEKKYRIAPVEALENPVGIPYSTDTPPRPFHYPQMCSGFPDASNAEFRRIDMSPGSVLFTPRGMWHYAESSGDSIVLNLVIDPAPAVDTILEQLRFTLLQDARWRAPLYGAWDADNPQGRGNLEALLEELRRTVARLTSEQVLCGGAGLGHRIDHIDEKTRYQRIPTARLHTVPDGSGKVRVSVINDDLDRGRRETLEIIVSDEDAELVAWLADCRGPIAGRDIAEKSGRRFQEVSDLIKELCRGELLMPLWFEPMPAE